MEVRGYQPENRVPDPARMGEVGVGAGKVLEATANMTGILKETADNQALKSGAENRLRGLNTDPNVDRVSRAIIGLAAADTSVRAWSESMKSKASGGLAGVLEVVSRAVSDTKIDQWGNSVDTLAQKTAVEQQGLGKVGVKFSETLPDLRGLVPEAAKGLLDKAVGFFKRAQGGFERNADNFKQKSSEIRGAKAEKGMSAEMGGDVAKINEQLAQQNARIAKLESDLAAQLAKAAEGARAVGSTSLEQKVAATPF